MKFIHGYSSKQLDFKSKYSFSIILNPFFAFFLHYVTDLLDRCMILKHFCNNSKLFLSTVIMLGLSGNQEISWDFWEQLILLCKCVVKLILMTSYLHIPLKPHSITSYLAHHMMCVSISKEHIADKRDFQDFFFLCELELRNKAVVVPTLLKILL